MSAIFIHSPTVMNIPFFTHKAYPLPRVVVFGFFGTLMGIAYGIAFVLIITLLLDLGMTFYQEGYTFGTFSSYTSMVNGAVYMGAFLGAVLGTTAGMFEKVRFQDMLFNGLWYGILALGASIIIGTVFVILQSLIIPANGYGYGPNYPITFQTVMSMGSMIGVLFGVIHSIVKGR